MTGNELGRILAFAVAVVALVKAAQAAQIAYRRL